MAAGFVNKSLSTLPTSTALWAEFSNGVQGPVHGAVAVDGTTGLAIDLSVPAEVVGSVASGSTDSGKPVKIGGVFNSTLPVLTTGQRADAQLDISGGLRVLVAGVSRTLANGVSKAFGVAMQLRDSQAAADRLLMVAGYVDNGSTMDMVSKANATSLIPSAAASVNATSGKASAGNVFRAIGNNVKASVIYLKIYNKATAPTVGTDTPVLTIPIPASGVFNIDIGGSNGFYLGTGIAYGFTTDATNAGTTALLAGDILDFCLTYS